MLMEILISTTLNTMLAATGIIILFSGINNYVSEIADWEMMEEIRLAAQRIGDDLQGCQGYEITAEGIKITPMIDSEEKAEPIKTNTYSLKKTPKGILYYNNQPITGESILGIIKIDTFDCTDKGHNIIHINIRGVNTYNGHSFTMDTEVLCHNMYWANENG